VICPRCLENNPESYRFCGMCGSALPALRPAAEPVAARASEKRTPPAQPDARPKPGERVQPAISGPSLLGLNQPSTSQSNVDSLYDTAFSSMESYFEPSERKPAWGRILLTLIILAALGGAAWWKYGNQSWWRAVNKVGSTVNKLVSTQTTNSATAGHPPTQSETKTPTASAPVAPPPTEPAEAKTPGTENSSNPPASAGASPDVPAEAKPAEKVEPPRPPVVATKKSVLPPKRSVTPKKPASKETAATTATATAGGDALFRRGEAYLYGRGVPKSCDQATKYLKLASDQSSAKARSALGTMYATGHCVPRDLPTSYRWFARALQVDPNNQVLEKDLSGVWTQMTPPERQLATKMKQ
jgi:Sel1 repeat-containing protein